MANHTPTPRSAVDNLASELIMRCITGGPACGRGASIWDKPAAIQSTPIEDGGGASVWSAALNTAAVRLECDIDNYWTSESYNDIDVEIEINTKPQ